MTWEAEVKQMEKLMPGIGKFLEYRNPTPGGSLGESYTPQDAKYAETENYKVVAARYEYKRWHNDDTFNIYGGVEYSKCIDVFCQPKSGGDIRKLDGIGIITIHAHRSPHDRNDLFDFYFVSLTALGKDEIEIAYADKNGNKKEARKIKIK